MALNSQGTRVFGPGEPFMVEWLGLDGDVEESAYYTLETMGDEGITCGHGVMAWAR